MNRYAAGGYRRDGPTRSPTQAVIEPGRVHNAAARWIGCDNIRPPARRGVATSDANEGVMTMDSAEALIAQYARSYQKRQEAEMSLGEFLEGCRDDPMRYATAAERLVDAIGEPRVVDTSKDERLGRIFMNRTIKLYPAFEDFYGMEETIERIVGFFRYAAQGLEERKQILYLLGPVGGGKSSLAERLKALMERHPIYVLKAGDEISPVFESPLGLFDPAMGDELEPRFGIPKRRLSGLMSPWAVKRLDEFGGDLSRFTVVRLYPSRLRQIAVSKTEPGDENNQDISSLVGKVDIRKLELYSQHDTDAYSYSGGLNRANQGILEFVEMFKAPIKMLHPLLTATQEGNYVGTENIGAIPFQGIIMAHSNEAEWQTFRNNKNNEAFIDRISVVKVPYCLRVDEEQHIYEKLIQSSELAEAPCAPATLDMLAKFSVLTRLREHENSNLYSKMRVYNGESLKDTDPKAKSMQEYRDMAGVDEGMDGISTRFAFKVLSETFNYDTREVAADPVHLLYMLEQSIRRQQFPEETERRYLEFIKAELAPRYADFIGNEIQKAYLESYSDFGQNLFERYVAYADAWIEDNDFKDPDTGQLLDRQALNQELTKIEKAAGIANPKDFRNEVVKFALRAQAAQGGQMPSWTAYEKIREVIEKRMFSQVEDLLPVISFGAKSDSELERKHNDFVLRMMERGYTERQVRRLVEWYMRVKQAG
ncbi:putative serine protein kinase, PrkA [Ectothiorhodospira mobilis]|uniref:Putative serine protein kinase, PrkA n=2 Tax=Ectothiorhodospira mobilis TaxID=195064 RepID=A0A1I4RM64_ECTMO|nr:putative serine protein kinase, PrkA [Ectothiorhodospira mobilis]